MKKEKFIWKSRHHSQNAKPTSLGISKVWRSVVAVSAIIGILITFVSQVKTISRFYDSTKSIIQDRTLGYSLRVDFIKYSLGKIILGNFVGNDVCIISAIPMDLDRNGTNTDLLIKFNLEKKGYECHRDESNYAGEWPEVAFVRAKGWNYEVPVRVDGRSELAALHLYTKEIFLLGEQPDPLFNDAITLFGYQHGSIEKLGKFSRSGPEGGRGFEMHKYQDGFMIRSLEGFHFINWSNTDNRYNIIQHSGTRASINNQHEIFFNRNRDESRVDNYKTPLEYDGRAINIGNSNLAIIRLDKLARLMIDPLCVAKTGFVELEHAFSIFALDTKEYRHEVVCYGENTYSILFQEKDSIYDERCSSDICPCNDCDSPMANKDLLH